MALNGKYCNCLLQSQWNASLQPCPELFIDQFALLHSRMIMFSCTWISPWLCTTLVERGSGGRQWQYFLWKVMLDLQATCRYCIVKEGGLVDWQTRRGSLTKSRRRLSCLRFPPALTFKKTLSYYFGSKPWRYINNKYIWHPYYLLIHFLFFYSFFSFINNGLGWGAVPNSVKYYPT